MLIFYYLIMLVLALALVGIYMFIWQKHFNVHITILMICVPIMNLGYFFLAQSQSLGEALVGLKLAYVGGCYLPLSIIFIVFNLCEVPLKRWFRVALMGVSSIVYLSTLTIGHSALYYKNVGIAHVDGVAVLADKQYGVMHTVFYIMVLTYYVMAIGITAYSFFRKNQIPRNIIVLLSIPMTVALFCYFLERVIPFEIELLPAAYDAAIIVYLVIVSRLRLYDISDSVIDSLVETGDTGFVSFNFRGCYLGSNETARNMLPELMELTVDKPIRDHVWMRDNVIPWLAAFREDETKDKQYYERDGKTYLVHISYLTDGRRKQGYQFILTDDTQNQQYINLLNSYNTQLEEEVENKTLHIVEMQEKFVLGMATMVEGRDNSTGGHIRRTREGVRILVEEMKKSGLPMLTDQFCRNVIKAAPMHDLGKITVDDAILRKPGLYTPQEYDIMKTHAAEGARIVHEILESDTDVAFRQIAENVAHYHHERWDGSGYPEGLSGEAIPLEARIMAIADVYDALVSKRVYKEKFSFSEANAIILDGMGTQFDKRLEEYYLRARPKLEEYYRSV